MDNTNVVSESDVISIKFFIPSGGKVGLFSLDDDHSA